MQQPAKVGFLVTERTVGKVANTPVMALKRFMATVRIPKATVCAAIALVLAGVPVLMGRASGDVLPSNAVPMEPKTAADWLKQGIAKAGTNDLEGAIAAFDRAIALKLDYAEAYYNRGAAYAKIGNARAALADYSQVILLKPNNAAVRYSRGSLRAAVGDREGAIADFQQAATLFQQQLNVPWQQKALNQIKQLQSS